MVLHGPNYCATIPAVTRQYPNALDHWELHGRPQAARGGEQRFQIGAAATDEARYASVRLSARRRRRHGGTNQWQWHDDDDSLHFVRA